MDSLKDWKPTQFERHKIKQNKNKHKRTCPKCGSEDIARILYGYPAFEKIEEDLYAGKIALGGCCFEADVSPKYHCNNCDNNFGIYMRSKGKRSNE